ncbi:MAG TPA: SRPBCC domain-containing protein [Actinomycetales bacterium]|nr:SRPBCC domain-containing protein [Actinomycetales bacterium]
MIISERFEVPVPRDQAVAFLLDVERMSRCVPGATDVRRVADDEYTAVLRLQVGPIRSEFTGRATVDSSRAPDVLTADVDGRDRATGSAVRVAFEATVVDLDGRTTAVDCRADVSLRGRLGQFGTGMITSTAKSVLQEFSQCASATLVGDAAETAGEAPALTAPRPSTWRIAVRTLRIYLSDVWSRLRSRGDRGPVRG